MNRDDIRSILRSHADRIHQIEEHISLLESEKDDLERSLSRTQNQTNIAIRHLVQMLREA